MSDLSELDSKTVSVKEPQTNSSNSLVILIAVLSVLIIITLIGGYFMYNKDKVTKEAAAVAQQTMPNLPAPVAVQAPAPVSVPAPCPLPVPCPAQVPCPPREPCPLPTPCPPAAPCPTCAACPLPVPCPPAAVCPTCPTCPPSVACQLCPPPEVCKVPIPMLIAGGKSITSSTGAWRTAQRYPKVMVTVILRTTLADLKIGHVAPINMKELGIGRHMNLIAKNITTDITYIQTPIGMDAAAYENDDLTGNFYYFTYKRADVFDENNNNTGFHWVPSKINRISTIIVKYTDLSAMQ